MDNVASALLRSKRTPYEAAYYYAKWAHKQGISKKIALEIPDMFDLSNQDSRLLIAFIQELYK